MNEHLHRCPECHELEACVLDCTFMNYDEDYAVGLPFAVCSTCSDDEGSEGDVDVREDHP